MLPSELISIAKSRQPADNTCRFCQLSLRALVPSLSWQTNARFLSITTTKLASKFQKKTTFLRGSTEDLDDHREDPLLVRLPRDIPKPNGRNRGDRPIKGRHLRKRWWCFLSALPTFVPSLSWQNDRFEYKTAQKDAFSRT
jgi:hypothetical protein